MQKFLYRCTCFLFCILLTMQFFSAAPADGLEGVLTDFMIEQGLDASNFSMSYYNLVTGESYSFNHDTFLPVGKLRFLPTHMYFYEEEIQGTFEPQSPEEPEFTIANMTLEDCRYHSIILSEDSVSEKMQAQIGNLSQYLELINQRYGMIPVQDLPIDYWRGNSLSVHFLMNCIQKISAQPELFTGLMANYSMVQKAEAFANGSVSYPIVQIRGEDESYVTAIAEVSAVQNFLLVASVKTISGGDEVLGKLNHVICDYLLETAELNGEEIVTQATTIQGAPNYYIGQERLETDGTLNRWLITTFSIAGGISVVGLVVWLIWRSKNRQY